MAAGDESSIHRHRHDDRDGRSHRDHLDERTESRSSRRSHGHRDKDESHRRRSRSPSLGDEHELHPTLLKFGVQELRQDDYFMRSAEFRTWLGESKGKYLDEVSSKDARRYFDRFARRWNEGRLADEYYEGKVRSATATAGSASQTRHRWAFTSKATYSTAEQEQLAMIRDNVDTLTNGESRGAIEARDAERFARSARNAPSGNADMDPAEERQRDSGWNSRARPEPPSAPRRSYAETQLEREDRQELDRVAQSEARRRARQERADQEESLHGRATGRDRILEKKRERNAINRDFANRRQADDGIDMDDRDLYDQDPLPRTDPSSRRTTEARATGMSKRDQARQERMEERKAEMQEKVSALREKDAKTMEMFKALAQERFGGS